MDNYFSKPSKFQSGLAFMVTHREMSDEILDRLKNYLKKQTKIYVDLNNNNFRDIKKFSNKYLVSYKFHTPTTYLYLTKYSGIRFCFFITNGSTIIRSVKYRFAPHLYDHDTLFEGHMINISLGTDIYCIDDILVHDGQAITNQVIGTRLKIINSIIDTMFVSDSILDVAEVVLNDYAHVSQLKSFLTDHQPQYATSSTGIVFIPVDSDIQHYELNYDCIKKLNIPLLSDLEVKDTKITDELNKKLSICFKLQRTDKPDVYNLYLLDNGIEKFYDIASIPDIATTEVVRMMLGKQKYCTATCLYDPNFNRWKPFMKSSQKNPDPLSKVKISRR